MDYRKLIEKTFDATVDLLTEIGILHGYWDMEKVFKQVRKRVLEEIKEAKGNGH